MMITKEVVRDHILDYLNQTITLPQLVDWAENALYEAEFEEENLEMLRDIIARMGVADVREFGLTWDDCTDILAQLGYQPQVKAIPIAA